MFLYVGKAVRMFVVCILYCGCLLQANAGFTRLRIGTFLGEAEQMTEGGKEGIC